MAMRSSVPRRPTAAEATAMTAGPRRKRTAMVTAATELPQAMILGCMAMKSPRLNMAIPSPASERMEMELATMAGMLMWNLQHREFSSSELIYRRDDRRVDGEISLPELDE
jgi:hypothetical protein